MDRWVLLSLLLAHVVGDFYLQSNAHCVQKSEKGLRSWFLYFHSLLIGGLSWLAVPLCDFWPYALGIAISHLFIDAAKARYGGGLWSFVADQTAHVAVLALVASSFAVADVLPAQRADVSRACSVPATLLATLLCMKPANIFIKKVLERYKVVPSSEDIKDAGALIGNLERILTIIFVLIGHYEAIGFIVAAKSILRFKDTDTAKAEYVLAGTFLSFGIAVVCGISALRAGVHL